MSFLQQHTTNSLSNIAILCRYISSFYELSPKSFVDTGEVAMMNSVVSESSSTSNSAVLAALDENLLSRLPKERLAILQN
jgi:hypothetical protein